MKKGDRVEVVSGAYRGSTGIVKDVWHGWVDIDVTHTDVDTGESRCYTLFVLQSSVRVLHDTCCHCKGAKCNPFSGAPCICQQPAAQKS